MSTPEGPGDRLGILGGTFDPPTIGHVFAATQCLDRLALDRVLFVVANDPWQKSPQRLVSPAEDRLALVEAAVLGRPGMAVSRIEIDRGGPSYTVETVEALEAAAVHAGQPPPAPFLIVGADVVGTLPTWHRVEDLARLVTLIVIARPGVETVETVPGWRVEVVSGVGIDVSSSMVRARVAAGQPIEDLVPQAVGHCIRARGLYAVTR